VDKVAAELLTDYSRAELQRWISAGELQVDGAVVKPRTKLMGGEVLVLSTRRTVREAWQEPQALELDVVYEDADLLIVNKPAGMVVHPGAGNPAGTLVNGLLHYRVELNQLARAGIVHRLDKDTSGLLVVAARPEIQLALTRMIQARQISRIYSAVCEQRMVAGQNVDAPIGRHPKVRTKQAIVEEGKPAYTEFRVLQRFRMHTLVEARLRTGRTHQIRVHLQSIGYPLVGDRRYGARGILPPRPLIELLNCVQGFKRQALHAWQLAFDHPGTGEPLHFKAELPRDMTELVALLQEDQQAAEP
jgi:23S rRNA pseudouridine1911/1915/1917 synthase